ncbi:hypothetical protein ACF07Q_25925 [Nocardiopsis dassonvillei]|uniref:hypothetical protein n=1 Tax=Nocardiopsis dassonvillei TaxID=2014 RepID=UPI0036F9945A
MVRAERGLRDVVTEAGNLRAVIVSPTVAGDGPSPCTGDRVAVRPSDAAASATVADEGLERTFAGISEPARDCRFADRARTSEPRCAGVPAVEDGRLPRRRLDSYHRLQRENAHAAARTDARLRAETKRQGGQGARLRRAVKQSPNSKA